MSRRADPPRDADGRVTPHNHGGILDSHFVLRHTVPHDLHPDEGGGQRVSSGAYSASSGPSGGMSVDIESWMIEDGLDILNYVTDPAHGAKRLNVGELRNAGFMVGWDPVTEYPENPHHGQVWGNFNGSKNKRRIMALAETVKKVKGET